MNEDQHAEDREKKRRKKIYGMRVSGKKRVLLILREWEKKAQESERRNDSQQKEKGENA